MAILINGGTVVFFDKVVKADVLIEDGKIAQIGEFDKNGICKTLTLEKEKLDGVINANGLHIFAGFVDMHTHLREPGQESKETILTGCQAAVKGGFTSVACMPNTNPVNDNKIVLEYVKTKAKEAALCKVYPICSITKEQKSEQLADMLTLRENGAVAFSDDGFPVKSAQMLRNALEYTKAHGIPILCHSEDSSLSNDGVANECKNATTIGLRGIPNSSEAVGIARDILVAESLGASVHICHVSTKEGVRLIREAKARGVKVTAETCPHYFSLTDDKILGFNTNAKINPPLRSEEDVKAVTEGIRDGTIDCIATDHAPHAVSDKECEFANAAFGASGLEAAFAVSYTYLVKTGVIDLPKLSQLLTKRPAEILKIQGGVVAEKQAADITIVDLSKKMKIDASKFVSKGKNTPFDGMEVFGEVKVTFVDGRRVF